MQALKSYEAIYIFQEKSIVPSDNISDCTKIYKAIMRKKDDFEAWSLESFNNLDKKLKSLGQNIDLELGRIVVRCFSSSFVIFWCIFAAFRRGLTKAL